MKEQNEIQAIAKRIENMLSDYEEMDKKLQALRASMDKTDELRAEMHQSALKLFSAK